MWFAVFSSLRAGRIAQIQILAGIILIGLLQAPLQAATNAMDQTVLHPAIPLLDEAGDHVLDSGKVRVSFYAFYFAPGRLNRLVVYECLSELVRGPLRLTP